MNNRARACVAIAVALLVPRSSRAEEAVPLEQIRYEYDTGTARGMLEERLLVARRAGDVERTVNILAELIPVLFETGDFELALEYGEEGLRLARETGDRTLEGWMLGVRGDTFFYVADYERALEVYEVQLAFVRREGDAYGVASALKNVGVAHKYFGRYEESVAALEEATDAFRRFDSPRDLASSLENLGQSYLSLGDFPRAFDALRAGLELARETENASAIQHSLMRLGTFYLLLALPEEALPLLEEARALADRMDLPTRQTWVMSTIAAVLAEQGRLEEALELQGEVLRIARTIDTGTYEGDALWGMGGLLIGRDPVEALTYLDGAVTAYEGIGRPVGWGVWADYGRALRAMGDLDRASRMYWKAIGGLESARQVIASDYHRATFFEQSRRIYEQLVELLIERYQQERDTSHIAQAFEVVERAKARNLTEAIRAARDGAFGPDDPALRRQERELLARRTELQRRLMASGVPRERRIELSRELDRAEREYDRLVGEIRRSDPRYAAALYPEPVGPELARTLIGRGSAIVLYFFTEKVVYRFLLTSERYEVEPLDVEPAVLSARVENYLELLAGDHDGWRDISRRLADELLPSLEGVTEIIFVPDRTLHFLPFETLLTTTTAGTRGRFLLETHTVSYTPSLTVLHGLARDETTEDARPADLLLFADPASAYVSGDDDEATGMRAFYEQEGVAVPPIPYSAREASAIHRLARRGSEVYIGDAASEAMLKSRELERFRVLHMATHGLISQWRPARSSLVLSPSPDGSEDGFLQVREIFQLRMNTDLVVLSACRTARGKVLGGEGVQGLAQAFLHAGSQTVVASLWDVDDVATAGLMDRFYRYLARGLPKGQALRRAKLDTLHTIGGAAPRHWGAFVMIGAAAQPVSLSGLAWWRSPGVWLLVVLVLGVTALGVRRVARRG